MGRKGSDRKYLILAFVCFIGLAILSVFNYKGIDEDFYVFTDTYYEGELIESMDPKTLYGALNAYQSTSTTSCITVPKLLESSKAVHPFGQGLPWVQSLETTSQETAEGLCDSSNGFTPYADGEYIIAPAQIEFTTSNVSSNKTDIIIEGKIGSEFKIRFEHVKEWWCHMDCSVEYTHTDVVGAGAQNGSSKVNPGTIIGKASTGTVVVLYRKNGNEWSPCSFRELYTN